MAFLLCAEFSLFPDDTGLGPGFTFAAMDFQDVPGGGAVSFVNATAGERGLQFPHSGLEIGLPVPVLWVRLRVGQFAGPYTIDGLNLTGAVASTFAMNFPNTYRNVRLRGPDLFVIRFTGGDNEGSVVSVCVPIP
jgi:hypothetical protein